MPIPQWLFYFILMISTHNCTWSSRAKAWNVKASRLLHTRRKQEENTSVLPLFVWLSYTLSVVVKNVLGRWGSCNAATAVTTIKMKKVESFLEYWVTHSDTLHLIPLIFLSKACSRTFPLTFRSWDHRPSDPWHTLAQPHDNWGLTSPHLLSVTPQVFPLLPQLQPFVEPVYLSEAPLGSPTGKTLLLTRRRGADWFSCWMCCSTLWQPQSPYWALSFLIGVLAFEMCAVIRLREPTA